jgi:hypothetical protein
MIEWFLLQNLHRPLSPPIRVEVQRIEIVDVLIVGESWRDHNEKNQKRFLHLARLRLSVSPRTQFPFTLCVANSFHGLPLASFTAAPGRADSA